MTERINNIWQFLAEFTKNLLKYLDHHRWQARVLFTGLILIGLITSITALIITIYFYVLK